MYIDNAIIFCKLRIKFFSLQSYYYDRDDVSLPGICKFFKKASGEEREHAMKLLEVQEMKINFSVLVFIYILFFIDF